MVIVGFGSEVPRLIDELKVLVLNWEANATESPATDVIGRLITIGCCASPATAPAKTATARATARTKNFLMSTPA
jgi:hypothetical protein